MDIIDGEIVRQPQQGSELALSALGSMTPEQIDQMVAKVDRAADARQRMIQICVKRSEPLDWVDFGGKPYLQGQGGQRIASVVGIQIGKPAWTRDEWVSEDYFCEVATEFFWPFTGVRVVEIGGCSTRDKFFNGQEGSKSRMNQYVEACQGNRELASNMLRIDVRKKALSNCIGRGVASVMGIKGLSWEALAKYGLTPEKTTARVAFDGGKAKGAAQQSQRSAGGQQQRRQSPAASKTISLYNIGAEPKGAVVAIDGCYIVGARSRKANTKNGPKDVTDLALEVDAPDGTVFKTEASLWGLVDQSLVGGPAVRIAKLAVGEYQGKPQYTVEGIEAIPEQGDGDGDMPGTAFDQ